MSTVYCIFHPATGIPGGSFVTSNKDLLSIMRSVVRAQMKSGNPAGAYPDHLVETMRTDEGYEVCERPADIMSCVFIDCHLEFKFPEREGGVGPLKYL